MKTDGGAKVLLNGAVGVTRVVVGNGQYFSKTNVIFFPLQQHCLTEHAVLL